MKDRSDEPHRTILITAKGNQNSAAIPGALPIAVGNCRGCKRGCSRGDNLHNKENGSETENTGAGFVTDLLMIELKEVVAVFCLVSVFFQH